MTGSPSDAPADINAVLRRYVALQGEEQRLKDEKSALQERLADFMARRNLKVWFPESDGQKLKVRCQETSAIEYNEDLLRERLGDRYTLILAPDAAKIRRALPELESALAPALHLIGSPAPEKVRAAIESGRIAKEEFAGAFRRTTRRLVAVARVRAGEPTEETNEAAKL